MGQIFITIYTTFSQDNPQKSKKTYCTGNKAILRVITKIILVNNPLRDHEQYSNIRSLK